MEIVHKYPVGTVFICGDASFKIIRQVKTGLWNGFPVYSVIKADTSFAVQYSEDYLETMFTLDTTKKRDIKTSKYVVRIR